MPARRVSPEQQDRLAAVSSEAERLRIARRRASQEIERIVGARIQAQREELEREVIAALDAGCSISAVARAFTDPEIQSPNRNAIYEIKARYENEGAQITADLPFVWTPREVRTVEGTETAYDVVAELEYFGPDEVSGTFVWRYIAGELEALIEPDGDDYPNAGYYKTALRQWLAANPYPGEE